ncbi:hypothetical protein GALMADRAFT_275883 [Galerina marginata CBS 339.88]|uniref:Uncharacterized protein n=1 Tax=Galerina marginata (strain CBS 339.88) TaxID=685588 RepID=A0A067TI07_GALM3|nr:hypothetical protein GALMADRAFT_275883 [Galerina marginata CBS 339.88]
MVFATKFPEQLWMYLLYQQTSEGKKLTVNNGPRRANVINIVRNSSRIFNGTLSWTKTTSEDCDGSPERSGRFYGECERTREPFFLTMISEGGQEAENFRRRILATSDHIHVAERYKVEYSSQEHSLTEEENFQAQIPAWNFYGAWELLEKTTKGNYRGRQMRDREYK